MESSWKTVLENEFKSNYFKELLSFVEEEYDSDVEIFPEWKNVFSAFNYCRYDKVKVVIIGQDPYPTKGHANGLCFSVSPTVHPLPKSLKNIFKELEDDLKISIPENGDLTHWASQGVLMLNNVLTVQEGTPDSHANRGWEQFTSAVIKVLNKNKKGIVYILWGSKAQKKAKDVDENVNYILKSPHPSPLSVYRGFWESKPFSKTNKYLASIGETPIKW